MIGRVIEENKTNYLISFEGKEYVGVVRGKFHTTDEEGAFPKVGDLVECVHTSDGQVAIENILPRKTEIARKAVESTSRQVMVTNVDLVCVIMGLDRDFSLSRLERYLMLAEQSNVQAVVMLNKADTVSNPEEYVQLVKEIAPTVPVYAISAATGLGMDAFLRHIGEETIAVLLGSSGAGKSTITNWLLWEEKQLTNKVRGDDDRGRHTTTNRHMFKIPSGGFLIDTPGMRELGVLNEEGDKADAFADIRELKQHCKFTNCDHEKSAGCAIREAIADGLLEERRLESYIKLEKERDYLKSKADEESAQERKRRVRKLHTHYNQVQKQKGLERGRF